MNKKNIIYTAILIACAAAGMYIGFKWLVRKQDIRKEEIEGDTEVPTVLGDDQIYQPIATNEVPATEHFSIDEYACKDGTPVPPEYYGNVQVLMNQMEVIRGACGNKPVHVNSGYRSQQHNNAVGGVSNSQHLPAKANDFRIAGLTPKQVYDTAKQLMAEGKIIPGGLGLYPTFVHYDIRGTETTWKA